MSVVVGSSPNRRGGIRSKRRGNLLSFMVWLRPRLDKQDLFLKDLSNTKSMYRLYPVLSVKGLWSEFLQSKAGSSNQVPALKEN